MPPTRPLKVFLCHASADKPAVRKLYLRLSAEGWIDPWLDEEKLSFGQHWTTTIEEALDEADVVLIFLSRNSVKKEGFVQRELNYAWDLSLEKPRDVIFLIPFRLDDCQVPRYLSSRQWGDYFGEKEENTYQILLRSLKQRHQQKTILEAEEQEQRDAVERVARERAEQEARERLAREDAERETLAKETREKMERLAKEKLSRDKAKLVKKLEPKKTIEKKLPFLGVGFIVFVALPLAVWKLSSLSTSFEPTQTPLNWPELTSSPSVIQTLFVEPVTKTPVPAISAATIIPTPILGIGSTMTGNDGMTLLFVPAGEFIMGSNSLAYGKPTHQVDLDAYWIDQTEVTNAQYSKCVSAGECTQPSSEFFGSPKFENFPVVSIDWNQARTYCEWAGRRLPTEAEWEKAARGTDGRTYPWGNEQPSNRFLDMSKVSEIMKVGNYPMGASPYGALDMASNAWEWVSSLFKAYPYDANDGRENMNSVEDRVIRGYGDVVLSGWAIDRGNNVDPSLLYQNFYASSTYRVKENPSRYNDQLGFRCAMNATP